MSETPSSTPPSSSRLLSGFKYAYLTIFFALLAGLFYPFITGTSIGPLLAGILVLFLGLAGGVLLYRAATSETRRGLLLGGGFTLIAISLYYIFEISGKI